jgi:hypothetical protein
MNRERLGAFFLIAILGLVPVSYCDHLRVERAKATAAASELAQHPPCSEAYVEGNQTTITLLKDRDDQVAKATVQALHGENLRCFGQWTTEALRGQR